MTQKTKKVKNSEEALETIKKAQEGDIIILDEREKEDGIWESSWFNLWIPTLKPGRI